MFDLWAAIEGDEIGLVFSTGRHLSSVETFYRRVATDRRADACILMVGTEIWHYDGSGYRLDPEWTDAISGDWERDRVESIVASIPGAVMQPAEWQSEHKVSYFLEDPSGRGLAEIRQRMDRQEVSAKLVYSMGRFVDLLPARSGKGEAVAFLARKLGCTPDEIVTAGDSGNDLDMMRPELGFRSVVVGNAADELRSFRAPHVYHATRAYAAGIREGLVYFGWLEV